jgi:pimeloyl-ACP methyl ester carboxylesterase
VNRFASSGGGLAYHDEGEGPVVLLLHGFPLSSYLWRDLTPALAVRHRVIAADLLGLGDSERPTGVPLNIRSQATYVSELLDDLGVDRVAIVGHAAGGGVAQLLVDRRDDVEALVLIDSIAFDAWPTDAITEVQAIPPEQQTHKTAQLVIRSGLEKGMRERAPSQELIEAYMQPWTSGDVAGLFRWARALDGVGLRDLEPRMARWELPTLILWGEEDPFHPPAVADRLNAAIMSSALGLVPGCGHLLPEEAPETIFPIIAEYLRANYLRLPHTHAPTGPVLVPLSSEALGPQDDELEDDEDGAPEPALRADQEVGPNA